MVVEVVERRQQASTPRPGSLVREHEPQTNSGTDTVAHTLVPAAVHTSAVAVLAFTPYGTSCLHVNLLSSACMDTQHRNELYLLLHVQYDIHDCRGVVLITPRVTQSSFCQRNSDTNARAARCSSSEAPKRCVYRQRQRQAARQNVTL